MTEIQPKKEEEEAEEVPKTFYSARHHLALTFRIGAPEPRSLGRGAGRRTKVENEGGEVLNFGVQTAAHGAGWGGGQETPNGIGRSGGVRRLFIPRVVTWP